MYAKLNLVKVNQYGTLDIKVKILLKLEHASSCNRDLVRCGKVMLLFLLSVA